MAANDYYNSHPTNPYPYRHDGFAEDYSATSSTTRVDKSNGMTGYTSSPFDNTAYPIYPSSSQQTFASSTPYHGGYAKPGGGGAQDPFADQNAIPMQSQGNKFNGPTPMASMSAFDHDDGNQSRVARKFKGFFSKRQPWVVYILSFIQLCVFIAELAKNGALTGIPIQTEPNFNPMIGPSPYILINMGARFGPCMRNTEGVQDSDVERLWPCPNATSNAAECSLSDLCGFGGVPNPQVGGSLDDEPEPDQWWRFILPIFLHAGLIHIAFNLLIQLSLGREMELRFGWARFLLVYFSSGIFGFVLGGNYAADGIASTGASGSLFGIIALILLDLLYTWRERRKPVRDLLWIIVDIIIAFALGLLPGLDNFSHIGGFLMGLVLGVCILHSPNILRQRISVDEPPYASVHARNGSGDSAGDSRNNSTGSSGFVTSKGASGTGVGRKRSMVERAKGFAHDPLAFFKGRKPLWWAWWLLRAGALVGVLVGFVVLLNNFYKYRADCEWCKYLSCIDINDWCDMGKLKFTPIDSDESD